MKKRFIFFRGLIRTLDLYTDEFVKIFAEQDIECLVLNALQIEEEMIKLKAFLLNPVCAAISFNNIGLHLEFEDGQNIWDQFRIPFYNILMDHPFHYKPALDQAPEQMILLCMDRNHVEYTKRFFPRIRRVEFFPHAGMERSVPLFQDDRTGQNDSGQQIPLSERQIDVLYAGGLSRYAAEGLIPDLGSVREFDAFALVKHALEMLIQNPALTTESVVESCLKEMHVEFQDEKLGAVISELRFLDSLAVSFYREQVIRTLAGNGVTVTVFGEGWDRCEWESEHVVYGGVIPPGQILELMCQSRIVLNTMTWFKRGAHDRIFNGMLAGAAVVSDSSEYLLEQFTDGKQISVFSLGDLNGMAERVKELLSDGKSAQRMADCGYQEASRHHRWINRLREVNGLLMENGYGENDGV